MRPRRQETGPLRGLLTEAGIRKASLESNDAHHGCVAFVTCVGLTPYSPRGPVGLDGLVIYKWKLLGKGQIVADYTGPNARKFTHKKLP